jgi:CRP-like cAMP-binding protein
MYRRDWRPMAKNRKKAEPFDIQEFLSSAGTSRSIAKFKKGQVIFSQDDPYDDVLYIQSGNAKLSIVNTQRPVLRGPGGRKAAWLLGSNRPRTKERRLAA